ncbi:MAG: ferredoxin family protein [Anaerolineales bacterium]|jgi:adenylylsulfate reductase subunit B
MADNPKFMDLMNEHLELAKHLRGMHIVFDPEKCTGVWECVQVCPVECWEKDEANRKSRFVRPERCIACNACVLQCPEKAIELKI